MSLFRRADRWLNAAGSPRGLAALRVLTGGFVLVYLLATIMEFARLTRLPATQFRPVGVVAVLNEPLAPVGFWLLWIFTVAVGAMFVLGKWFRFSGPTFAVGVLVLASYHSSWGQMLHFEHLFTLHLLVLAFSPAAAAWALDTRGVDEPAAHERFGWPVRLLGFITVLSYVIAGIAKLRLSGLEWVDGNTLTNHVAYSATRLDLLGASTPPLANWAVNRSWLMEPLAVLSLALELAAPAVLISKRFRNAWVVGVLVMHTGIALMMGVWFPYQGLGFALVPLFLLAPGPSSPTSGFGQNFW